MDFRSVIWQQPCDHCFSKTSTFSRRFRHTFFSALSSFGTLVSLRHTSSLRMTNWRYYFLNIIPEPFLKNVYFDHWWQNKPFRLPTRNKTNHSPVFQNYSHTVIQYTSFNVKPTKILSDPVAEAFGLIHRHLRVKISAVWSVDRDRGRTGQRGQRVLMLALTRADVDFEWKQE